MRWDGIIPLKREPLHRLALRYGGTILSGPDVAPGRIAPIGDAGAGDLAPFLGLRWSEAARDAVARGAALLVDVSVAHRVPDGAPAVWVHEHASWAMAALLDDSGVPSVPPAVGAQCNIASSAVLGPRVVIGERVTIGAGAVLGAPGFGWARGPHGVLRAIPQLAGVFVEDDVWIGPLCTVDAGTLSPTRIRRGAKLDAQVHVAHNCDVGEGAIVAAQSGFAGSVTIGRGAMIGGQVGVADHVTIGAGARIAAKSGVIADVPGGATVAGYPAAPRWRWLRAWAKLYRDIR